MDKAAWLGLGLGTIMGGTYAWLHVAALKRDWTRQQQGKPPETGRLLSGASVRVLVFLAVLFAVLQYTDANKWWLGGSLAVAYGVPFFWGLKVLLAQKK